VRINCIFNNLDSFAADFISASFRYLREITECAADLVPIKVRDGLFSGKPSIGHVISHYVVTGPLR
jgi:hypothetical protein